MPQIPPPSPPWSPLSEFHLSPPLSPSSSPIQQITAHLFSEYNPFEEPTSPPFEKQKMLSQRTVSSLLDEALVALKGPRSFDNIRQRMALANKPELPVELRVKLALSVPKNVESNSLLLAFAKDEAVDIPLRASCALGLVPSVQKYSLIKTVFNTLSLDGDLKLECLLKLLKCDPKNVSEGELFPYLRPELVAAYSHSLPHPELMRLFRQQLAYDEREPLLLRAQCALKALPAQGSEVLCEEFAKSPSLPLAFRVAFAAALPEGPSRDALAKAFMEDLDVELRILWTSRLPAEEKEQGLRRLLVEPNLSKELQYFCASNLREGPIRQVYMELFAQDTTFPIELQINAARNVLNLSIKGDLLTHFAQREEIALFFRLPCILEMPKGELRNNLLSRLAEDISLDVNFRVPCMAALPNGPLKTDLLKIALRDTALYLKRVKQALMHLPSEEQNLKNSLSLTFALNPLLPLAFRYECTQFLPESHSWKSPLQESLKKLIQG